MGTRSDHDRIAQNEALFRQINERVRDVGEAFEGLAPTPVEFVCECGLEDCARPITLSLEEYEAVRAVPTQFFVLPGHVTAEVERIVRETGDYVVVQKVDEEADVARETDPRA